MEVRVRLRRLGPNSKIKVLQVPKECRSKIWLAGRGTNCQIYTKSKFASRQHFCIIFKDQKFFISDLQSSNGTFVNDEKVVSEKLLTFGSQISVGVPSEMWKLAECVVYVFEPYTETVPDHRPAVVATKIGSVPRQIDTGEIVDVHPQPKDPDPRGFLASIDESSPDEEKTVPNDSPSSDVVLIGSPLKPEMDESSPDEEKTVLNNSPSSDVVLIESPLEPEMDESKPAKIPKLEVLEVFSPTTAMEINDPKPEVVARDERETIPQEECTVDSDLEAYEALTQVDETQIKPEPDLLNYSLTEDLIEISDSDDDCVPNPNLKIEGSRSPEGAEEDEDVVVLETIVKMKRPGGFSAPLVACKVEDDLTEMDKKWLGRLLKIKSEGDVFKGSQDVAEIVKKEDCERRELAKDAETFVDGPHSRDQTEESIGPCATKLARLSTDEGRENSSATEMFQTVEVQKIIVKRAVPKKSVTFDMVPQIKYFQVPSRPRLTPSEKGRMRFMRIIYNICNWNTHWLEECKKVAPDKDPPDICEERLRKIPRKFPSHSDYMAAFIPVMLLQLWNRVKDKWVNSGESGFRQTVSCDSCEGYPRENLHVYKCTGLVQNVDAHKELLREGHLVLLRLHQTPNAQFVTPASEKYSKKLGYLVFGFVESRIYERYHNQSLHGALAERCASALGDLHLVRLTILVKKRPSFQVDKRKLIQLTVIHRISQEIRMFRGICFLPDSPLCPVILKPTKIESTLAEPPAKERIVFKGPLDDVQSEIVRKLSYACSSTNSFLYCLHGAAGTGKGQVIAALILQLLYGKEWNGKRPKIIYCTQRSVPLDEMVAKLKRMSQTEDQPFTLVRVGPMKEMKPEVKDVCLSNLAASLRAHDKRIREGRKFCPELELLKDADVVCTTCLSAGIARMCSAFEKLLTQARSRKVVCFVDEAMSSSEKDSVVPLLLGVTHLILVGDIYQMEPTLSGEKTHFLGLDIPLFWRIYRNFSALSKELWPIFTLKTQYRMNSSLSKFTSPLIYNTALLKSTVSVYNNIANIKTHLVLVDRTPENVAKGETESREAKIVSQLMRAIMKAAKVTKTTKATFRRILRLAVITCDSRQTKGIQALLPKSEFPDLEIDHLLAFQGREFDVVAFVYDGRKILTSWLATALTRTKSSLFVCLTQQSTAGHPLMRKMTESAEKYNFLKYVRPDMAVEEFQRIITK